MDWDTRTGEDKPKKKKKDKEGGAKAQPQVMMEYIDRGLFPFKVSWPEKPKEMIVVLAAHTQAERKGWVKALESCAKDLEDARPQKGYLFKKKGRHGGMMGGLFKVGWDKRWFELLQADPEAGIPPSFTYWDDEKHGTTAPKGAIVLNQKAMILSGEGMATASHPNVFAISSQGADDPKPLTTTLAADTQVELDKWTHAVERALHSFKPKGTKQVNLSAEEAELMKKTVEQLKLKLDYMGVEYDKTTTDKQSLAVEILRQKNIQAIQKAKGDGADIDNLQKQLKKDEARLMHRDVEELRALLDYMEVRVQRSHPSPHPPTLTPYSLPPAQVDYDKDIDSKTRLVSLIINQKRMGDAAMACQRIVRKRSSGVAEMTGMFGHKGAVDVS